MVHCSSWAGCNTFDDGDDDDSVVDDDDEKRGETIRFKKKKHLAMLND